MLGRLCLCLFFALCALVAADEVADFAAYPDPEADRYSQNIKEAKERQTSDAAQKCVDAAVSRMEEIAPDALWRDKLLSVLMCDHTDDEGNLLAENYHIIKAYQKNTPYPTR